MTDRSDTAVARSADRARVYRALAELFLYPEGERIQHLVERDLPEMSQAVSNLTDGSDDQTELRSHSDRLCRLFEETDLPALREGYDRAFDESSAIRCAPTEMDQLGDTPQLEMTRTFEMADVAGFYRAFGVQIAEGGVRVDHIAAELEFMNLLAVKEAIAHEEEGGAENAQICRDAARKFLRDHLARWVPRFGDELADARHNPIYSAAGWMLKNFVAFDVDYMDADSAPLHRIDATASRDHGT